MPPPGYVGKAGQLVVMAEFLLRGYNVAMPEVDEGDDIFVVHNQRGQLWRIQVKTAVGKAGRRGHRGKFSAKLSQLNTTKFPDLFYFLAMRCGAVWELLVMPRHNLYTEYFRHGAGSRSGDAVVFTVRVGVSDVLCSRRNWQAHRHDWTAWPTLP
jgi:hypothetical protein